MDNCAAFSGVQDEDVLGVFAFANAQDGFEEVAKGAGRPRLQGGWGGGFGVTGPKLWARPDDAIKASQAAAGTRARGSHSGFDRRFDAPQRILARSPAEHQPEVVLLRHARLGRLPQRRLKRGDPRQPRC